MRQQAASLGWKQLVEEPTRGKNKLDLALSDMPNGSACILPKIADHRIVKFVLPCAVPETSSFEREVWLYGSADWCKLRDRLDSLLIYTLTMV